MTRFYTQFQLRPLWLLWLVMVVVCVPLIQRVPNGADHYFMIDVGETQIVLNNWGTLHMTGYPHYTILGNLLTDGMTLFGVRPLIAAAVTSLLWGLVALALIYALLVHLTGRPWLAAGVALAYALTRTVWIHFVIAEIYTFGLALLAGLLLLALWRGEVGGFNGSPYARVYWLALLGGLGVAHHRAIAMAAPALVFAAWSELTQDWRKLPQVVGKSLLLGLLGFTPYLYLMVRARQGADWVYGEPGTLAGLWWQFTGQEVSYFIGPPQTFADFLNNLSIVNTVLLTDLTYPGIVLGLIGLFWAVISGTHRKAALTMLISAAVAYGFHAAFYTDVLSALILPITLSMACGWAFLLAGVLDYAKINTRRALPLQASIPLLIVGYCGLLIARNAPFIHELVTDTRGLETIAMAETTPDGSTLMLPWGPRFFAVGYDRDIEGGLQHIQLADHNADYTAAFQAGALVVPEYVRYSYPLDWWRERLGADFAAQTVAPGLVGLQPAPEPVRVTRSSDLSAQTELTCTDDALMLHLTWQAPSDAPLREMTVFMHLLDENGALLAQDDHPPVYGWRPTSAWQPGERIHDMHRVPRLPGAHTVRYGLYYVTESGEAVNDYVQEIPVVCDA